MGSTRSSRPARAAALCILVLAAMNLLRLAAVLEAAVYLGVLTVLGSAVAAAAAYRLWRWGSFDARALAGGIAVLTLGGQAINLWVGIPGAHELEGRVSAATVLTALAAIATLVLLAIDSRRRSRERTPDPYAL